MAAIRDSATAGHILEEDHPMLFHQSLVLIELLVPTRWFLCEFPIAYVKLSTAVQPSWSEAGPPDTNLVQRFQRRRFKCDLLSKYA